MEDYLAVDPMELELGVGLIRVADPKRGGDLLERIQRVRQNLAADIGIILPKVRVRDNMRLEPNQYRIKIADVVVAQADDRPKDARSGQHHRRAPERNGPPARRRTAHPRRRQAPDRRTSTDVAGGGR